MQLLGEESRLSMVRSILKHYLLCLGAFLLAGAMAMAEVGTLGEYCRMYLCAGIHLKLFKKQNVSAIAC